MEKARFDAQAPDTGAQRAGIDAAVDRLKSVSKVAYGIVAGLIVVLLGAVLLVSRRRKPAGADQPVRTTANVAAAGANTAVVVPAVSASADTRAPASPPPAAPIGAAFTSFPTHSRMPSPPRPWRIRAGQAAAPARCQPTRPPPRRSHRPGWRSKPPRCRSCPICLEPSGAGGSEHLAANDPIARLMELAKLRASGMLTESEFNQLKASIIASASRDSAAPGDHPPHAAL